MSSTINIPAARSFRISAMPATDRIGRRVRVQDLRGICSTYLRLPWDFNGQGITEQATMALEGLGVDLEGATATETDGGVIIATKDFSASWD